MEAVVWMRLGALLALGAVSTWTDVRENRVPNWLSALGALAGLVLGAAGGWPGLEGALLGMVAMAAPFMLFWWFGQAAVESGEGEGEVGAGDVKLAGALGAVLGWPWALTGLFWGVLLGAAVALGYVLVDYARAAPEIVRAAREYGLVRALWAPRPSWRKALPQSPWLSLGALIAWFLTRGGMSLWVG